MTYAVPEHVADNVIALANEGRIIQGDWRRNDDGRELVCALTEFEYMPSWLAHLVTNIGDRVAANKVREFAIGLAERAKCWSVLDAAAWERIHVEFRISCIELALQKANAAHPDETPDYLVQVREACAGVIAALRGDGDLEAASSLAKAAAAATEAWTKGSRAAEAAAWSAWSAVEKVTVMGAEATAAAARRAERRAAAGAAAYWSLVQRLFALIDAEIARVAS